MTEKELAAVSDSPLLKECDRKMLLRIKAMGRAKRGEAEVTVRGSKNPNLAGMRYSTKIVHTDPMCNWKGTLGDMLCVDGDDNDDIFWCPKCHASNDAKGWKERYDLFKKRGY